MTRCFSVSLHLSALSAIARTWVPELKLWTKIDTMPRVGSSALLRKSPIVVERHIAEKPANRGEPDFCRVIPLFACSEDIRKVIYTTNAIKSVTMTLRKVTRNHRIFPSDEAVYKVVYPALRQRAVARGLCPFVTGSRHLIA